MPPKWTPRPPAAKADEAVTAPMTPAAPPPPATIDEARDQGLAVTGTSIAAPLAPKKGPIPNTESGHLVVTVVKDFWESPTIKAIRNAVITAVGLAVLVVAVQVVAVQGDLSQVNWQTTQKAAIAAAAFSLASGYAAWWKKRDNDPIKG